VDAAARQRGQLLLAAAAAACVAAATLAPRSASAASSAQVSKAASSTETYKTAKADRRRPPQGGPRHTNATVERGLKHTVQQAQGVRGGHDAARRQPRRQRGLPFTILDLGLLLAAGTLLLFVRLSRTALRAGQNRLAARAEPRLSRRLPDDGGSQA
jgi:hypothetical protein